MLQKLARWSNEFAIEHRGRFESTLYKVAARLDPKWSVPWYNLGLQAKYSQRWKDSLHFNQRAVELNPGSEDAWWNLGIAATALHDWPEAIRAWKAAGIPIEEERGEPRLPRTDGCVRLDPDGAGEVVWGERLDPARFVILNVPLPESGRRYRDIILNDGAEEGTRELRGHRIPVLNELEVWQRSAYRTYEVLLNVPGDDALRRLVELTRDPDLGIEDWSTIRMLCSQCSLGNPGPHECANDSPYASPKAYGFAAHNEQELRSALSQWKSQVEGADYAAIREVLATVQT